MTALNAPTPGTTRPSASSARLRSAGELDRRRRRASSALAAEWTLPRAVVEDDDGGACRVTARPSSTGCRPRSGSSALAWRNARANALNSASAMWCGSRPPSTVTCTVSAALKRDRLEDVAHHRAGEVAADEVVLEAGRLAGVHEERAAGDVDDGLHERLVERHEGVAEAGDAAPCRRAPAGCAWPSTMPMSSTVWCTSISMSPLARTVRSVSECFANAVSRWS